MDIVQLAVLVGGVLLAVGVIPFTAVAVGALIAATTINVTVR